MPEAVQVFIAPAVAGGAARATRRPRHRCTPSEVRRAPGDRRARARRPSRSSPTSSSTTTSSEPRERCSEIVAASSPAASAKRTVAAAPPAGYTAVEPTRKGIPTVISPRIDKLLEHVDSNYAGVIVAAKRARQINSYYHNLGEGTFDEFPPPMVETALEKLPHDRPRGGSRREDQVPLPVGAGRGGAQWPGCCSASAAGSPHTRRSRSSAWRPAPATRCASMQTPTSRALRRQRVSFAALTGAPVLVERVRARPRARRLPGRAAARPATPISHLALVAAADVYLIAPATANTIAKLAARARRQPAHELPRWRRAARSLVAPAMNDRMYEHAATQANLDTLRARGARSSSPAPGASRPRRARHRAAGRARRAARAPARRLLAPQIAGAGRACWSPPAARASRSTASLRRQPLLGADGLRARRRGPRRGARGRRSCRRERGATDTAGDRAVTSSAPPPSCAAACEQRVRRLRRAADGRGGRRLPSRRRRRRASSRRTATAWR